MWRQRKSPKLNSCSSPTLPDSLQFKPKIFADLERWYEFAESNSLLYEDENDSDSYNERSSVVPV